MLGLYDIRKTSGKNLKRFSSNCLLLIPIRSKHHPIYPHWTYFLNLSVQCTWYHYCKHLLFWARIIWHLARQAKERQPPVSSRKFFVAFGNKKMILPTKNQVWPVASQPCVGRSCLSNAKINSVSWETNKWDALCASAIDECSYICLT